MARWLDAVASSTHSLITSFDSHDEHVALITYSDKAQIENSLTGNFAAVQSSMQKHTLQFDGGATNIGDGIEFGAAALSDNPKPALGLVGILIVLTDVQLGPPG